MPRDPHPTHTAILDAAEALVMDQGFGATSIDKVLARAGVTKGAFFYHFDSKAALARALVERYAARERALIDEFFARAEAMSRDPLQQVMIVIGLFREMFAQMNDPNPGCLFAAYCYEAQLFDDETMKFARGSIEGWRRRFGEKLAAAMQRHPPRLPVSPESLADQLNAVLEGAFVLSRTTKTPALMAEQLGHCRNYLELLFGEAG